MFTPLEFKNGFQLSNRVICAPMCMYSAKDGLASPWHPVHIGQLCMSGASLVIMEATGVTPEGRISPECLGLWSDEHMRALAPVISFVRAYAPKHTRLGIQLAHAGRKGSTYAPFNGRGPVREGGFATIAPSAVPFDAGYPAPREMTRVDMDRVRDAFVSAAQRADRAGFDALELHYAHGYLLSSFLSPLANRRADAYGGSLENRMRFPLEVFEAVRAVWPRQKLLGVRFNGTDYVEGGWTEAESVVLATELGARGVDYVHISSGGNTAVFPPIPSNSYQVELASRIREKVDVPVVAVGRVVDAEYANGVLERGEVQAVALARGFLDDPRWVWHAAVKLGKVLPIEQYPPQYQRCHPQNWVHPLSKH